MVSYQAYRLLSQYWQAKLLLRYGVHLDVGRNTSRKHVDLYALNDFYVEIYNDTHTGQLCA